MTALACLAFLRVASLLPPDAAIVEITQVPSSVQRDRLIVLWMRSPESEPKPCPQLEDWAPSCPDETRGCHFRGPTRVSLVYPSAWSLINNISMSDPLRHSHSRHSALSA